MTDLVIRKVRSGGVPKLKLAPVVRGAISGGVVKLERVQVICPACGQQVEAIATDGRVKGYCTVAKQYVDFPGETQHVRAGRHFTGETRAKISAAHIGKHPTAETKAKMSAAHIGRHPTAETKAKLSVALIRWHNKKRGSKLNNLPQGATL